MNGDNCAQAGWVAGSFIYPNRLTVPGSRFCSSLKLGNQEAISEEAFKPSSIPAVQQSAASYSLFA